MQNDPHEPGIRRPSYSKDAAMESFFLALNQTVEFAALPRTGAFDTPEKLPLIYVVGPPRSGTTLLSQLIARCLPIGYINNLIARFWLRPSVGIALSKSFFTEEDRAHIPLHSVHGTTNGIFSPHEFGYFWRRWLPLDESPNHHLSQEQLSRLDRESLKNAIEQEILVPFGCPVAIKNVICGFQAALLTELHPRSLFIYIERDLYSTAASILKVRKQRYGDYTVWWSLKPSTYPFGEDENPAAQVVRQVLDCRREFRAALLQPDVRAIFTSYESVIADPAGVLSEISSTITDLGWPMNVLEENLSGLERAHATALPPEWEERLQSAIEKSQPDFLEKK